MLIPRVGARRTLNDIARAEHHQRLYDQLPAEIRKRVAADDVKINTELVHWLLGQGVTEEEICLPVNWSRIADASEQIAQRREMGLSPAVNISLERLGDRG